MYINMNPLSQIPCAHRLKLGKHISYIAISFKTSDVRHTERPITHKTMLLQMPFFSLCFGVFSLAYLLKFIY